MDTTHFLLTNPLPGSREEIPRVLISLAFSVGALILLYLKPHWDGDEGASLRTGLWWSVVVQLAILFGYWTFQAITGQTFPYIEEKDQQLLSALVMGYGLFFYVFLHWSFNAIDNSQWMFRRRYRKAVRDMNLAGLNAHRDLDELDRAARQRLQQELSKARRNGGSK